MKNGKGCFFWNFYENEIKRYLDEHLINKFIVIDDAYFSGEMAPYHIQTAPTLGFTENKYKEALEKDRRNITKDYHCYIENHSQGQARRTCYFISSICKVWSCGCNKYCTELYNHSTGAEDFAAL